MPKASATAPPVQIEGPDPDGKFDPEFFRFLKELARHNEKVWFTANKERYLKHVQGPSSGFVRAIGPELSTLSPYLIADPRPVGGSLMRIYRDVRFSKDKSPYRTTVGIHFMLDAQGKDEDHFPGFFLHLAPQDSWVYAGVWQPAPPQLERIRRAIVDRPSEWKKLRASVPPIEGESLKRPPAGFDPSHPLIEDLKRKGFTAGVGLKDSDVTASDFPARFLEGCGKLDPLNRFLAKALGVDY